MLSVTRSMRTALLAGLIVLAACQDLQDPVAPAAPDDAPLLSSALTGQEMRALRSQAIPEVLALPQTVFGGFDDARGQFVFGVENPGVARSVQAVMSRLGASSSMYRVEVTEPIHFANTTLRTVHRPTRGGIQINYGNFVCTLGFNVDHAGGRSFITNSHCTNQQGTTGTTTYFQPTSSGTSAIATEADDPAYARNLPGCSRGKVCRMSDAARALYEPGVASDRGLIAKTTGENTGSLDVAGTFTISSQNDTNTSFSGTLHKVGRTRGWGSGNVTQSCVTVNVSGTNLQLLCQTLVQNSGVSIVQGGDSGSPVFRRLSGDDVELVGILWGGNTSGDLFVFSPLRNIQDELGSVVATAGSGNGENPPPPPVDEDDDEPSPPCVPRGRGNNCK